MLSGFIYIAGISPKSPKIWLSGLLWLVTSVAAASQYEPLPTVDWRLSESDYRIEVAKSSHERRLGLMFRRELADDAGMLLVYPREGDHRIWMKNMVISLRVVWIDSDWRVVDIQRLIPCDEEPCPVYSAADNSRYVLELNDRDHPLAVGDRLPPIHW